MDTSDNNNSGEMFIRGVQREETGQTCITFPKTHGSHSRCPCWGTQTPGPHPGAGCAWEPPPAGLTGRPGSDLLHTMRSQSKSPSGTKPSHRVTGQITDTSAVHTVHRQTIHPLTSFPGVCTNMPRLNRAFNLHLKASQTSFYSLWMKRSSWLWFL